MKFLRPQLWMEEDFRKAQEIMSKENFDFAFDLDNYDNFKEYIYRDKELHKGKNLGDFVQGTFFVLYNQQELIGRLSIRHELNDYLIKIGGHIGYSVLPEFRKKGYATKICAYGLDFLRKKTKEKKALITCSPDNLASIKVILKNGGVFENKIEYKNQVKNRYWITL